MELAVFYRTLDGKLAYARQSLSEAFKRWIGKHILIRDAEHGKLGDFPEEKVWKLEDVNTMETMDAIIVLDAELKKERIYKREEPRVLKGD